MSRLPAGLRLSDPAVLVATWFGAGLLPKLPGSWGSLAALPFAWAIADAAGPIGLMVAAGAAYAAGLWASGVYLRRSGDGDPGPVVIDEVAGQWLTLVPVAPDPWLFLIGFLLFRAADILKPFPANWIDRRLGGVHGVMLDDIVAGLYAGAILYALSIWVFPA